MTTRLMFTPMLALFAIVLLACQDVVPDDPASGALGVVDFSYRRGCFFGCSIEQPLLTGSHQTIDVTGPGDDEGVLASTSDPDRIGIWLERECACVRNDNDNSRIEIANDADCDATHHKVCDNRVEVEALSDGDARLTLESAAGGTIDHVQLRIRDADSGSFFVTLPTVLGAREETEVTARVGDTIGVEVELYDVDGQKLLASDAVTWRVDDPQIAQVSAFLIAPTGQLSTGLAASVHALNVGDAQIDVDVPGLLTSLVVHVQN